MSEIIKNNEVEIGIDAGRLLYGLSRIGYTTASALCDIIDNSVRAGAENIQLLIRKENEGFGDTRKNNVQEYIIIDDGIGMNEEGIIECLKLGSTDTFYGTSSLSKFGLGLKSASFSQSDVLEVIASIGDNKFSKFSVSLPKVQKNNRYFAERLNLNNGDQNLIQTYLKKGKGTIIRLSEVRKINHPPVKRTLEELTKKVGVIYHYFIREKGLKILLGDNIITPFDVLFVEEANSSDNLDENSWDGKSVRWIEKPKEILLDKDAKIKAIIEITQLPHPPIYTLEERGKDKEIRDKYMIGSGNYGYYVYRNKRLISWAESFDGIIPQNQDLYSFRGRILIDDSADDCFNIDVKKSTLTLSDEAWNTINDLSSIYKRKSIGAWNRAKSLKKEIEGEDPNQQANTIIQDLESLETLPGQIESSDSDIIKREQEIVETMRKKLRKSAIQEKQEKEGKTVKEEELKEEDIEITLKGEINPYATKVFRVPSIMDNILWEPYYDTDRGNCVRINKFHRFARLIFENNGENIDMQIIIELFLHQIAEAEVYALKHPFNNYSYKDIERILTEFRRIISETLAHMCRHLEDKLPPLEK